MTEPLPLKEFGEMFDSDPQPDGKIVITRNDDTSLIIDFKAMVDNKGWHWRRDEETGTRLIVHLRSGRLEIPEINIALVQVHNNSDEYVRWKSVVDAAEHVIELQQHLDRANERYDKLKEEYLSGSVHSA